MVYRYQPRGQSRREGLKTSERGTQRETPTKEINKTTDYTRNTSLFQQQNNLVFKGRMNILGKFGKNLWGIEAVLAPAPLRGDAP